MKLLINDACVIGGKPFSHSGVLEFTEQIIPHQSTCLRCVFKTPFDEALTCAQAGVIGTVVGVLGTWQGLK